MRSDELVIQRPGRVEKPVTVHQCTSASAEPVMLMSIVPGQEDCRERTVRRGGKGTLVSYEIRTVCHVHGNRIEAQMQLLGDLKSSYQGSFEAKFPETPLNNTGRMVVKGRWLGACAAGQRPGDMVLPNGVTVNVLDDHLRGRDVDHSDHQH